MGTPIPKNWPELEDSKWYKVTEDSYQGVPGVHSCQGGHRSRDSCCRQGDVIKAHFALGNECKWFAFLCIAGSPNPKRVICLQGPYDTEAACRLDL